jgi:hypothetical protein
VEGRRAAEAEDAREADAERSQAVPR